eukprot:s9034_g1.t1
MFADFLCNLRALGPIESTDCPLRRSRRRPQSVKVHQQRIVDFGATDRSGREVVIREKCLITSVTQPLLSLGRLAKRGWFPQRQGEEMLLAHGRAGSELTELTLSLPLPF